MLNPRGFRFCFNPRSHAGSDGTQKINHIYFKSFNPRSHAGSDFDFPVFERVVPGFNPRSHAGSDVIGSAATYFVVKFQSTLPRRERHRAKAKKAAQTMFQSTLPRRERRGLNSIKADYPIVSIHAPTQGATVSFGRISSMYSGFNPRSHAGSDSVAFQDFLSSAVSIHAPTQGATLSFSLILRSIFRFNPRSHAGSDQTGRGKAPDNQVSIHAPTQGATQTDKMRSTPLRPFQSTLPRRERQNNERNLYYI